MMGTRRVVAAVFWWLWAVVDVRVVDAKKKRKAKESNIMDVTETEYTRVCSECYRMATHAHKALIFNAQRKSKPSQANWLNVLRAGCLKGALEADGDPLDDLCERVILGKFGAALAEELVELLADADDEADSSIADVSELQVGLCGPDSITEACPSGFHVHAQPSATAAEDGETVVEVAMWNGASVDVEIHLISSEEAVLDCAMSETTDDAPNVRLVSAGDERSVQVTLNSAPTDVHPIIRLKPRGAPCFFGFDITVDLAVHYSIYKIVDTDLFKRAVGDYTPSGRHQRPGGGPLTAIRLYHDGVGRDVALPPVVDEL